MVHAIINDQGVSLSWFQASGKTLTPPALIKLIWQMEGLELNVLL